MLSVYSIQTPSLERASISLRKYVLHMYYVLVYSLTFVNVLHTYIEHMVQLFG